MDMLFRDQASASLKIPTSTSNAFSQIASVGFHLSPIKSRVNRRLSLKLLRDVSHQSVDLGFKRHHSGSKCKHEAQPLPAQSQPLQSLNASNLLPCSRAYRARAKDQ